jgi:hypothetical protein
MAENRQDVLLRHRPALGLGSDKKLDIDKNTHIKQKETL